EPYTSRRWALIASLGAALYYTYPELAPVILACAGLFSLERLWTARRGVLRGASLAVAIWVVLVSPFLEESARFVHGQAAFALAGQTRPGEGYFPGLLIPKQQISALWSLGGEFSARRLPALQLLLGLALFLLLLVGLVRLLRLGAWSLVLTVVGLGCG